MKVATVTKDTVLTATTLVSNNISIYSCISSCSQAQDEQVCVCVCMCILCVGVCMCGCACVGVHVWVFMCGWVCIGVWAWAFERLALTVQLEDSYIIMYILA